MSGRGHQLIHSDALSAELEALGLDSSLFGAAGIPAPIFQALVPRRAGVFDESANTFGTGDEPASFTRASLGLYRSADGAWASAAANAIRPDHDAAGNFLGYLFEPASTNDFLHSAAAATQDIALGTGTFTCSVHGAGSVTSSDGTGTASGHGAAADGAPNTIVVSGAGTITYTVSGSPTYVQVEESSVPSSPIITAGIGGTRAADVLGWATKPEGFLHTEGMLDCTFLPGFAYADVTSGTTRSIVTIRAAFQGLLYNWVGPSNQWRINAADGTSLAVLLLSPAPTKSEAVRMLVRWESTTPAMQVGVQRAGAWTWGTAVSYDGAFVDDDELNIGAIGSEILPFHLRNLRLYNRCLSTAQIEALRP